MKDKKGGAKTYVDRADEYAESARAGLKLLGIGTAVTPGKTTDMLLVQNTQAVLAVYELLRGQIGRGPASASDRTHFAEEEYAQNCQACGAPNMVMSPEDFCYSCGQPVGG